MCSALLLQKQSLPQQGIKRHPHPAGITILCPPDAMPFSGLQQ